MKSNTLNRREVLKSLTLMTGITFSLGASAAFISGCTVDSSIDWKPQSLSSDQVSILEKATERILPRTDTPGANDALVHRYIDNVITNIWDLGDRDRFLSSLEAFDNIAREKYKNKFIDLKVEKMDDVLSILVTRWKENDDSSGYDPSLFETLRDLTVTGFASSEVGAKEFFKYDPIPGPYQGCIDYSEVGATYAL